MTSYDNWNFNFNIDDFSASFNNMCYNLRETVKYIVYNGLHTIFLGLTICGLMFIGFCNLSSYFYFTMLTCILNKLGRKRIIMDRENDEPYLVRYYLFLTDRSDNVPFNVFLHKFLKSDSDNLHDHPWGYFTLILWGGYWEYMYENDDKKECIMKKWRGPGFHQKVSATHVHRIELDEATGPCWTLFIPMKRVREWGFWIESEEENKVEWIESEKYFEEKSKKKEE